MFLSKNVQNALLFHKQNIIFRAHHNIESIPQCIVVLSLNPYFNFFSELLLANKPILKSECFDEQLIEELWLFFQQLTVPSFPEPEFPICNVCETKIERVKETRKE